MSEYMKKKKTAQTEQTKKTEALDPRQEMTNGIPNSVLQEIFAGTRKADPSMLGTSETLAPSIAAKMSRAFGMDVSGVKISRSKDMADTGMRGLAQGNRVILSPDVDLNTMEGQAILGHELSHIHAQAQGIGMGHVGLLQDASLEHQADVEGMRAARGLSITQDTMGMGMGMNYGFGMQGVEGIQPLTGGISASAAAPMQAALFKPWTWFGSKKKKEPATNSASAGNAPQVNNVPQVNNEPQVNNVPQVNNEPLVYNEPQVNNAPQGDENDMLPRSNGLINMSVGDNGVVNSVNQLPKKIENVQENGGTKAKNAKAAKIISDLKKGKNLYIRPPKSFTQRCPEERDRKKEVEAYCKEQRKILGDLIKEFNASKKNSDKEAERMCLNRLRIGIRIARTDLINKYGVTFECARKLMEYTSNEREKLKRNYGADIDSLPLKLRKMLPY